jgi:hypothetical protein
LPLGELRRASSGDFGGQLILFFEAAAVVRSALTQFMVDERHRVSWSLNTFGFGGLSRLHFQGVAKKMLNV